MKVVDSDGNELPPGETGELLIKGCKVTRGYWNKPEANENALYAYPKILEAGVFGIPDEIFGEQVKAAVVFPCPYQRILYQSILK